ncbi:MAG: hypothetical protein LBI17_00800 [Rickettsiales bacterium]|jgi:hypothetical protein|nr:hypothetical protein [Rickettsiales bacterium]
MQRIPNRTRANFEKLYGMYPFQEGGRFVVTYERAASHELVDVLITNPDQIPTNVGSVSEHSLTIESFKEQLMHMPERDLRSFGATVVMFKELKTWAAEELARRHSPISAKSRGQAKKYLKDAARNKAFFKGAGR